MNPASLMLSMPARTNSRWDRILDSYTCNETPMTQVREMTFLLMTSALAAIASALLLAMPIHAEPSLASLPPGDDAVNTMVVETTMNVIENWRLRLYCIIGALGGAWLSVGMFPPPKNGIRPFALKFSCSCIAAIMFSPALMHKIGVILDPDYVLAVSGLFGLVSWAMIQIAVPLFLRIFTKKGSEWGGLPDDKNDNQNK